VEVKSSNLWKFVHVFWPGATSGDTLFAEPLEGPASLFQGTLGVQVDGRSGLGSKPP